MRSGGVRGHAAIAACAVFTAVTVCAAVAGCAPAGGASSVSDSTPVAVATPSAPELQLLGAMTLPGDATVGGISGIDYDTRRGDWILATDDRGEHGPARFWRARIDVHAGGFGTVTLGAPVTWRQPGGAAYLARGAARPDAAAIVADVEAVRVDPRDGTLWYASEGDRAGERNEDGKEGGKEDNKAHMPSFVRQASTDGGWLAELPLPERLRIRPGCVCGGRANTGPEGLAFTPDGNALWVALEGPLIEDGAAATPAHGAPARITLMSRAGGVLAQHAYPLDAVPVAGDDGGPSDNGISEVLALDEARLLVLERSGRKTRDGYAFDTRLYVADMRGATVAADKPLGAFTPLTKQAVAGFAPPPGWQDNYEAMAWGPPLPDGRRTLVVASDNNFTGAPTRFLVFALRR